MADNVAVTAGTGTSVATDDIGGVHYQRVKVTWGADGAAADASAANPLPVVGAAGTALMGKVQVVDGTGTQLDYTLPGDVVSRPATTPVAGTTKSRIVSTATNNLTSVKATPGQIYAIRVFNTSAALKYLKLYDKASAPVVASDVPVWTIPIPAGGGFSDIVPIGIPFTAGIAYAIVNGLADTDATNVAAGDVHGQIVWI